VNPIYRGPNPYDGVIEEGMVVCIESYMGAVGERDGVKLEQQVLVTLDGIEPISTYPWESELIKMPAWRRQLRSFHPLSRLER